MSKELTSRVAGRREVNIHGKLGDSGAATIARGRRDGFAKSSPFGAGSLAVPLLGETSERLLMGDVGTVMVLL